MGQKPDLAFDSELRLAVVMYGGVSLAIYMNGVTQELLRLVQATAADSDDPAHARYADDDLRDSSALVYRELARLPRSGTARQDGGAGGPIRRHFVIDILSGTSAGGINAVFLAKALARGQSLDGLTRLWRSEADIGRLINDAHSRAGDMRDLPHDTPRSLLNSHRMYRQLLDALEGMDQATPASSPLVDQVDLFVTATDLEGLRVRLQLGGGEVAEERRHRKRFHLRCDDQRNDFDRQDNPFLAFICRCTSSFPVAFEPMQFKAVRALHQAVRRPLPDGAGIPGRWVRHFTEYDEAGDSAGRPPAARAFGDGGYLDNKPFSHAIDAIARQPGGDSGSVERKLLYIEPDPERLTVWRPGAAGDEPPNAVENALSVVRLRSYETIREELLRLRGRNRLVGKIRSVIAGVDADFEAVGDEIRSALARIIAQRDEFKDRALDQVVRQFGSAYGGYHRLKVGQLTDDLSAIVVRHAGFAVESDEFRTVRLLVQAWRNARYNPNPESAGTALASEFAFLTDYDLAYRIRRLSFVIEQLNRARVLEPTALARELRRTPSICGGPTAAAIAEERPSDLGRAFDELRRGLAGALRALRRRRDALLAPEPGAELASVLRYTEELRRLVGEIITTTTEDRRRGLAETLMAARVDAFSGITRAIAEQVQGAADATRAKCHELLQTDGTPQLPRATPIPASPEEVARYVARHYYTWYELYDSMVFPIVCGTEVGEELAPAEPLRISPLVGPDGRGHPGLMPSGQVLGHFGAFLDEGWRARDILIGRLNAAEKLVRLLLAGTPHEMPDLVEDYVARAHRAILEEECGRPGSIVGRTLKVVHNADTPERRLQYVQQNGLEPETLSRERAVEWIARSTRVLSQVFRGASELPWARRLARTVGFAGALLTGMVEVVVPTRWWGLVLRRWIPRLVLFGATLWALGTLLGREQVSGLGGTILLLVAGFVALTIALRSWIAGRLSWAARVLTAAVALVIVVLLVIGVLYAPDAWREISQRVATPISAWRR